MDANGTLGEIQNVGDGINSPKDDFVYLIDTVSKRIRDLIETEVKDLMTSTNF